MAVGNSNSDILLLPSPVYMHNKQKQVKDNYQTDFRHILFDVPYDRAKYSGGN